MDINSERVAELKQRAQRANERLRTATDMPARLVYEGEQVIVDDPGITTVAWIQTPAGEWKCVDSTDLVVEKVPEVVPLTLNDRCDACGPGSQAFVEAWAPGWPQSLLLCGHHFKRHGPALKEQGARILQDNREQINTKPSVSANV